MKSKFREYLRITREILWEQNLAMSASSGNQLTDDADIAEQEPKVVETYRRLRHR